MKDPTQFDQNDYYSTLGKGDRKKFKKLFNEKYTNIDEERAKESFRSTFNATAGPEYHLFRDVVNAFSSEQAADGSDSGFETTIVNPLYELGHSGAEVLLAKKQPTGVHLCFVSCNVGGERSDSWREEINRTDDLLDSRDNRERIKSHIQCSSIDIRSVQYVTFTREIDLVDIDMDVLKIGTNPDHYAVWKLIESEIPDETGEDDKTIKLHDGNIANPNLHELCEGGIDPTLAENDDIRYCLTTHPVFPLGEVCLDLYLSKKGIEEEPKEFTRRQFTNKYLDKIYFGENRERIDWVASEKIDHLLEIGCEYGILDDEDEVREREYRLMWDSEDAGDIKSMVKEKYFDSMVPDEMGDLAFERAKREFEPEQQSLAESMEVDEME